MSSQDALRAAMGSLGVDLAVDKMELAKSEDNGLKTEVKAGDENVRGVVTGKIVYFPVAPGVLVPAWSQVIFSTDADWYVLTDARDGTTLWRKNIRDDVSTQNARFRVYVQADGTTPADNPAPNSPSTALPGGGTQFPAIAPTIVSMFTAMEPTASQNGWIDDCPGGVCTAAQTQTLGNNAIVCMDQTIGGDANICDTSAAGVLDGNGRPTGNPDANSRNRDFLGTTPRDFQTNFLPPPQGGNPEAGQTATGNGNNGTLAIDQFRRGMVTHLFYITNWYHDKLSNLGFNEAAGNFQQLNFSGMGLGNDRVNGDADDGSGTNNANFSTPPDGTAGRMQMYRFTGATIDRDGSLDAEIVMHELTHGTSNRLIGNGAGLAWSVGAGMGEGWSDFYALSLLNNTNADNPDARYASGAYATYKLSGLLDNYVYGIRRFPYSTDNSVNPMTWADTDETTANYSGGIAISPLGFQNNGALEVHNVGEIWMVTLWEMRSRIIADPAGANGNVPAGNQTSLRLVTDALKMTPLNPTFLDARNALLDADCATNACANETSIWAAFADRGLGFKAASPLGYQFGYLSGHLGLVESFESANLDVNGVTVTDTIGNSSGFIDPDEPARVFVNLKNGWRNAAKGVTSATATLTTTTPGVMILDNSSTYGAIAPQANATGDYFVVKAAPGAGACGSSINLTMTITSSLGTVTRNFSIRVGAPSGTAAPVTYSRSAVGLSVPNSAPVGVSDSMNITDDYEIADIDFRVDSLLHTATGDVTVMLKGPTGYGTDLISTIGGGIGGGGTGDDFTNMLIDDSASADMLIAPNSAAPFTGSWKPIFNNASWTTVGFPTDPVGELGRFNGTSTLGTWRVQVSDQAQIANAAGTLNGWSLIVTPRAFVCTAFVPTAAAVSVSGRILDANGQGVSRAVVTLSSGAGGTRTAITNGFGYYRFEDVGVGENYVFGISSKRYQFAPQVITVNEEMTDLNFTAQ
jgi:subtilisin-like proprotein convertase family protein